MSAKDMPSQEITNDMVAKHDYVSKLLDQFVSIFLNRINV